MMNLLIYLLNKNYRVNYSKKILSDYNEANKKLEQIYEDIYYTRRVSENLCAYAS